jgi:hypothetical protein
MPWTSELGVPDTSEAVPSSGTAGNPHRTIGRHNDLDFKFVRNLVSGRAKAGVSRLNSSQFVNNHFSPPLTVLIAAPPPKIYF